MAKPLCKNNRIAYNFIWILITSLIVFVDQITKYLVVTNMNLYDEIPVISGFFNLHFVLNEGAGLGMLSDARWVFMTFTTIVIVVLVFSLFKNYFDDLIAYIAQIFILAGGIGNMIDRVFLGKVIDFFQFQIKFFVFIFNVADVFITFGTILLIVYYLFFYKETPKVTKDE